jgi:hypothetical protein
MSQVRPPAALCGQAGSATSGRPSAIRDASSRVRIPSASAGSVMRPSAINGTPFRRWRSSLMKCM